jgi:hypothetical protein
MIENALFKEKIDGWIDYLSVLKSSTQYSLLHTFVKI